MTELTYDLEKIRLPKGVVLIEHKANEKIVFRKNKVLLVLNIEENKSWRSDQHSIRGYLNDTTNNKPIYQTTHYGINNENIKKFFVYLEPVLTEEEELSSDLSPSDLVGDMGFSLYSNGVSGTIRKYFKKKCVISYARDTHACFLIIKMQRGYKALSFVGFRYNIFCREIPMKHCLEMINKIREQQIKFMQISEDEQANIISQMI
jgi:hypothetical protein